MEDKAEIEAKKETIVEVKKEEKKKEGLKDILNNKKTYNNKKFQKGKCKYKRNKLGGNNLLKVLLLL